MILSFALLLTNPFPADSPRIVCQEMEGYVMERLLRQEIDGNVMDRQWQDMSEATDPYAPPYLPAFFPDGMFSGSDCGWYTHQMRGLGLEPLKGPSNQDVLRFTWLRTFHNPIAISLVLNGHNTGALEWARGDGAGGYDPGEIIESDWRILDVEDIEAVRTLLNDAHPCTLEAEPDYNLDGSLWILETLDQQSYCVEAYSNPSPRYEVGRLGLKLLELTGISIDPDDIY